MESTLLVCSASILALVATPAFAANEPAKAAEPASGDIIVTATRNETLLSKTPDCPDGNQWGHFALHRHHQSHQSGRSGA